MLRIGCHLSSSKGYLAMGKEAVKIGANTFQFFTRNPRGSKAKDLNLKDIKSYLDYAREHRIEKILGCRIFAAMMPCFVYVSRNIHLITQDIRFRIFTRIPGE